MTEREVKPITNGFPGGSGTPKKVQGKVKEGGREKS